MIRLRLGNTIVRVHALALLILALSFALGARAELAAMLLALFTHEGAHLAAARLLRVRVEALDLMPFGGALTLESPYRLGRGQLLGVSLAGPFGNALGLVACAALAWWEVLPPAFALDLMRFHVMLAAFNLLPALPLDGGRALYALARPGRGRARALTALIVCGYVLAGALTLLALLGWARTGVMNLALLLPAVFLVASGARERRSAALGTAEALYERMQPGRGAPDRPERMRLLAVDEQSPALEALRALHPREEALLAVYRQGTLIRLLDSRALEQALLNDSGQNGPLKIADVAPFRPAGLPHTSATLRLSP